MKRVIIISVCAFISVQSVFAQEEEQKDLFFGILVMGGGRYDDVRMCVATPAGVKGGPIGDIMFSTKYRMNEKYTLVFNLPVMRPILFAVSHDMLQFEPELILEMHKIINEKRDFIHGPGLGLSFHYGTDYNSDTENPTESFFAFGPIVNYQVGILFKRKIQSSLAIKAFYTPLFAFNGHENGTVAGGTLQYGIYF